VKEEDGGRRPQECSSAMQKLFFTATARSVRQRLMKVGLTTRESGMKGVLVTSGTLSWKDHSIPCDFRRSPVRPLEWR